jgi:hypothetical protein
MRETERRFKRLVFSIACCASLLLACGLARTANAQSRVSRQLLARAESVSGDRFTVQTSTPRGVRVFAVARPRMEMLRAIDEGFAGLFAVARKHGYRSRLDFASYTVFIARADRTRDSQGGYSPDIAVAAGQYAGGGYDQGGYIYAAGMVLAFSPESFIIAEHTGNVQRVAEIVRYEGEHLVLYHNDRALYQRTADHSQGGGHPILR